jgi:hypothetical protein
MSCKTAILAIALLAGMPMIGGASTTLLTLSGIRLIVWQRRRAA